MFSKNQIKFINSLSRKKFRQEHGLFKVEGKKGILELLSSSLKLHSLYTVNDIFESPPDQTFLITEKELGRISSLSTPQTAVAVFHIPETTKPKPEGLVLALDGVQDPGNMGTIIRMCDWFGVKDLVCSTNSVDCYNPKVVQATMGSISRINIHYTDLVNFLKDSSKQTPVYGAFLEGTNVYQQKLPQDAVLIMGNEANGITPEVEQYVTNKVMIPQFGNQQKTESLNVATATAVFLSEFSRKLFTER